jgi:archaemetzincin
VPVGPVAPAEAQGVAQRLSRRITLPVHLLDPLPGVEPTYLKDREQVDADLLLVALEGRVEPGAILVGLTGLDIAIPIFTFVFGRARQLGRALVVSSARLDPAFYGLPGNSDQRDRRTVLEILHELGHLGGLPHCTDASCLMSFAGTVEKVEVRGAAFCQTCHASLPAWLHASP